jgi:uncharacterized protein (TIGR02145 family)
MSKLNKKNGKNNNQNNYRVEQLEPRLMMDAAPTDTDWKNEIDDVDISTYNLPATTEESIEGLIAYNSEGIANRVSLPDVLDSREIDFSDEVDDVKDFVKDIVEALQEEAEENAENAKDAAQAALIVAEQNYNTAKAAYESLFPDPNNISPAFSQTEQGITLQTLINGAQNAYNAALAHYNQVTTNFQIDASTLCARLVQDNENNNWSFTDNSGKINVSISINQAVSIDDSLDIVPDIAEKTQIDVAFKKLEKDNVKGFAEVSFEIDGNSQTSINSNTSVEIEFDFFQDLSKIDAKIGILGLTSIADSNESNPDLKIMGTYTLQGDTSSYDTEFDYDLENLNFETEESYCLDDDAVNCSKYGRLYKWAAAMDGAGTWTSNGKGCGYDVTCSPIYPVRGICPEGWHLPDTTEFKTLFDAIGGASTGGIALKSTSGWKDKDGSSGNGTDAFGFSALPAGQARDYGRYDGEGGAARFWSSTEANKEKAYDIRLLFHKEDVSIDILSYKFNAYSIRCVKDLEN